MVAKKLADALAMKCNESYSLVTWMRCCMAFSLARSAFRCVLHTPLLNVKVNPFPHNFRMEVRINSYDIFINCNSSVKNYTFYLVGQIRCPCHTRLS